MSIPLALTVNGKAELVVQDAASYQALREQVERLEVHYLSNPDDNFTFALLSDWRDSVSEHAEGDDALLIEAMAGIARLNDRYTVPAERRASTPRGLSRRP